MVIVLEWPQLLTGIQRNDREVTCKSSVISSHERAPTKTVDHMFSEKALCHNEKYRLGGIFCRVKFSRISQK